MENKEFNRTLTLKSSIYLGLSSMIGAGLFNNIAPTSKISSYGSLIGLLIASSLAKNTLSSEFSMACKIALLPPAIM